MPSRTLPPEVVSLVHHVELNKAGWWDKGIQHLVQAVVWLSGEPLTPDGIVNQLGERFHVRGDPGRIKRQVEELGKRGVLVALPDGQLRLSEHALKKLEEESEGAEDIERKAKAKFLEIFSNCCPALVADEE